MATSCGLCREVVSNDHRRRKKLHGPGCEIPKEVLGHLTGIDTFDRFPSLKEERAVLCSKCEWRLKTINGLESKIATLKTEVQDSISALKREALKRPLSGISSDPRAKFPRSSVSTVGSCSVAESECEQPIPAVTKESPNVQVHISYKSGNQSFNITTPVRKRCVKRLTRKSYISLSSTMVNSPTMCTSIIKKLATKIRAEMKSISSDANASVLKETVEAVKNFSWDTVILELLRKVPTLMSLLKQLVNKPAEKKPLLCLLASQLLKSRHQHMGLVQRAVSIMLYGNGSAKQVFANLQPLNVTMSYQRTNDLVKLISKDHDKEVKFWQDQLLKLMDKTSQNENLGENLSSTSLRSSTLLLDDEDSDYDDVSTEVQCCSPNSTTSRVGDSDDSNAEDELEPDVELQPDGNTETDDVQDVEHCVPTPGPGNQSETWFGYKFVGDNWDMNVKPSFQRQVHHEGQSLHHFHGYAAKDRINLSGHSDVQPSLVNPDPRVLLPSSLDLALLKDELTILMSRILAHHMDEFKKARVPAHVPSAHSREMASKSEVVPLGVLLFNENKLDEMGHILDHYMTLVPTVEVRGQLTIPGGSILDFDASRFFQTLFGGDQLTVARIRGVQALRDTQARRMDKYEGLEPVVEDWHARMTVMKAMWGRLYKLSSASEKGTLYQLRNLIHRTNVPSDPEKNMNAAEDFMLLILHAHVVAAARAILKKNPTASVQEVARSVLDDFGRFPKCTGYDENHKTRRSDDSKTRLGTSADGPKCVDSVFTYATEVLSLGLIWHGFHDAIREGDGDRILRYWKFLLVLFKSTKHRNYAKEAVNLLVQYYYVMSERKKTQLLWSRFINTRGYAGANIPCDLHMEHLNRRLKQILRDLGANVNPSTIVRAGKSLAVVHHVCQVFEQETATSLHSDHHPIPSFGSDFSDILKLLEEESVFVPAAPRQHQSFQFSCGLMESLSPQKLRKVVEANIMKL